MEAYYRRIVDLGLTSYLAEFHTFGYTVIPPELVASKETFEGIRDAVLRVAEKRTGIKHTLDGSGDLGRYACAVPRNNEFVLFYLLFEGREFEDWLENETLQAMLDIIMRGSVRLDAMDSIVKWKGDGNARYLHADSAAVTPEGVLPSTHASGCNSALLLTDYTHENGATSMVPGSHLLFRQPRPGESVEEAVPVEAPAGSLLLFHGNIWHGAFPKQTDGLRLNLTTNFVYSATQTQESYQRDVPKDMLDRHSEWFARTVGADNIKGWKELGPQPTYLLNRPRI